MELSEDDQDLLDEFLETVLAEHRSGKLGDVAARERLSQACLMLARGEEAVLAYMRASIEAGAAEQTPQPAQ